MMLHLAEYLDASLTNFYGNGLSELERKCMQSSLRLLIEEKCVDHTAPP
jgi:hypothetical protein